MIMDDSILNTVKPFVGLNPQDDSFDVELISDVNTIIASLSQLGAGPSWWSPVIDHSQTWTEYYGDDPRISMIKSYVGLKVRSLFDPPTNGTLRDSLNESIRELEWRIRMQVDP